MSTFDLNRIVESLQSPKIKNRNDALNLLAGLSPSKLRLHPRQFNVLVNGLLRLIDIEKQVFANNSSNPVILRLSTASAFLRDLLEEELKNAKTTPRYKHCHTIVSSITTQYFVGPSRQVLEPCALSFSQVVLGLLLQEFFITHLTSEAWMSIYKFLVKAIDVALEEGENTPSVSEAVLNNHFQSVYLLIGGRKLTYLPLYRDRAYFPLLRLIKRSLNIYDRKETSVIVACYRLINKLVVILATEDIRFCNNLIKYALKSILQFSSTSVESLFKQFCIFLNLDPVYRYFNLQSFPQLVGGENGIVDGSQDASKAHDDLEVRLYTVGTLIQELIKRLCSLSGSLTSKEVILSNNSEINDWFTFPNIQFRANDLTPWLLLSGTAKLVDLYYRSRPELTTSFQERLQQSGRQLASSFASVNGGQQNKRHKLNDLRSKLWSCDTALQFYMSLATNAEDNKLQLCGLQLLTVHCELFEEFLDSVIVSSKGEADTSVHFTYNESTILDLNMVTSDDEKSRLMPSLSLMVKFLSESKMVFWSLLCCRCLLSKTCIKVGQNDPIISRRVHQLLKMLLPLIKDKEFSSAASSIIVHILQEQSESDLHALVDESLKSQIMNIADLADLAGPATIDRQSLQFWWSFARLFKITLKNEDFVTSFNRWFIARWAGDLSYLDSGMRRYSHRPMPHPDVIRQILCWLSGQELTIPSWKYLNFQAPNLAEYLDIQKQMKDHANLQSFISHQTLPGDDRSPGSEIDQCVRLRASLTATESLCSQISDLTALVMNSEDDFDSLASWAVSLTRVIDKLYDNSFLRTESLRHSAMQIWRLIAENVQGLKEAVSIVRLVLNYELSHQILVEVAFPFDKINFAYHKALDRQRLLSDKIMEDSEFDDFSSSSGDQAFPDHRNSSRKEACLELTTKEFQDYFEFTVLNNETNVEAHIRQLESADSPNLLACLLFYVDFLGSTSHIAENGAFARLVRIVGEGPLSDQSLDRSDETISTCCKLLKFLFPICLEHDTIGLKNDCNDLYNYLVQCSLKELILTESKAVDFWKLNFEHLNVEAHSSNVIQDPLMSSFLQRFHGFPNCFKIEISDSLVKVLGHLDISSRMSLYRELFLQFTNPQSCVEDSATYCLFFSLITCRSRQLRIAALFNLIECANIEVFRPYLKGSIRLISNGSDEDNLRKLFLSSRVELLKYWWTYNHDIIEFPYEIFGYLDLSSFISQNYRQIVAILYSSKDNSKVQKSAVIGRIARIKRADVQSLVCDSLPMIIPMAYTSEGIRNTVFKVLSDALGDIYKLFMRQKLPLIVLETLKLTDFKSEKPFLTTLPPSEISKVCFTSDVHVDSSTQVVVSPSSSFELINALVQKYWVQEDEPFWSSKNVYFFLRQLGREFIGQDEQRQIFFVRSIKYVLSLGTASHSSFEILRLVADIVDAITTISLESDFYKILQICDPNCLRGIDEEQCLPTVFKLLCKICKTSESPERARFITGFDTYYQSDMGKFGSSSPLIDAVLNRCKGEIIKLTYKDFENFLLDPKFQSVIDSSFDDVLSLFSVLLSYATRSELGRPNNQLVKLLLTKSQNSANDDIKLWLSEYLCEFYLAGDLENNIEEVLSDREFLSIERDQYLSQVQKMDFFLELLSDKCSNQDFEQLAFNETIMGSILWKFESKKGEVQRFMDFDRFYPSLKDRLVPLDFHSCVLINSSDNSLDIQTDPLEGLVTKFSSVLENSTFEEWTSQLVLSLIQEVAKFTSMASLLASYVLKFPKTSGMILPRLICFYINLTGLKGARFVQDILGIFWKSFRKPYDFKAMEMIKDTVLLVRVGDKLGIEVFRSFYESLNKADLFLMIKESSFSKSALMLFEDAIDEGTGIADWRLQACNLAKVYESLDDEDLFQGLPQEATVDHALGLLSQFGSPAEKVQYVSGQLDANAILRLSSKTSQAVLSLIEDGLLGVSKALGLASDDDSNSYEWAWKLNLWDIPLPETLEDKNSVVYSYFKLIHDFPSQSEKAFNDSTLHIMQTLTTVLERTVAKDLKAQTKAWLETLSVLRALNSVLTSNDNLDTELVKFNELTKWFENADLSYSEDILKARQISFKLMNGRDMNHAPGIDVFQSSSSAFQDLTLQGFTNEVVRSIEMYRRNEQVQKMVSATMLLDKFVKSSDFSDVRTQEELQRLSKLQFAKTLWKNGKTGMPVAMLKDLELNGSIRLPLKSLNIERPLISAMLAEWLADSRQSLGSTILTSVIDPMKESIDKIEDSAQRGKVFHLLAHFCERQYKSRSLLEQLEDLSKRVQSKRNEIEEIKTHYGRTSVSSAEKKSVQKYYNRLKSQLNSEDSELNSLRSKREIFAGNAAQFYLKSLLCGDEDGGDIDNFFSLFLELAHDDEIQESIHDDLKCLPSFKPLSWCTQLLSRISPEQSQFQISIQGLIFRICNDHPYHSLYYLISLMKHEEIAKETSNSMMLARVEATKLLENALASQTSEYNSEYLLPIEKFADQSIVLSEYKSSKGRKLDLEKLKVGEFWTNNLPSIPPPTLEIPVSHMGYKNVPKIVSIEPKVSIATSGLSLPKIATFNLSDGSQHKMLLKHGTDDLRQDATMEQVFEKVNHILEKDREARKRRLRVRTYKAVPLGPKAGVIEFVLNSKALIEVIRPYHQQLDGLKSETARQMMKDCQTEDLKERIRVFEKITGKIHPVLRHYFTDNFISPDSWFQSRQIYTRGIAASSMVGYILGLGDRHCNNILLDEFTGEPIHIDLGVAFDQGKRLPIPETVPFRLTRDIVDGFGFMGTNGSFSKLCEHSFRVLRTNKDRILAILDVLRWDPLYSWSISPIRKKKLQGENGVMLGVSPHEDGSEAGTALLTVVEKLNSGGLSVEATVRELIQEATSVDNLAVIYCGWCPFF